MTMRDEAASRALYDSQRYFIKDLDERKRRYALYYEALPTDDKVIFYESMSGVRMMDNPYAIFRAVLEDKRFADYTHVWSVGAYDTVPKRYRGLPNVVIVTRHTDIYLRYLASAKHIIGNSTLPEYFVRKPDQKYLNTWHGIAYKRVGRAENALLGSAYSVFNMLQATHVLTPCHFMTQLQLHGLCMSGVPSGELAEVGYPRIDMTLNLSEARADEIASEFGIDRTKRTVLYAPTWRSEKFDTDRLAADLKGLSALDANVIFMGHHMMLKHLKNIDLGNVIVPPASTNTNELLGVVDILITDYSSIFFDFIVTGLPIVHYMYDYDEYYRERGLNLEEDDLPGVIVKSSENLVEQVRILLQGSFPPEETERYRRAKERFCPHEDGAASRRAVEWFFFGDTSGVKVIPRSWKRSVVFWGGRLTGGPQVADFLARLRDYAARPDIVPVLVVARSVESNPQVMDVIRELGAKVSVIARPGHGMVASPEEDEAKKDVEHGNSTQPAAIELHRRSYLREYRRVLGHAAFDESIEFENNSRFWKELASCAR